MNIRLKAFTTCLTTFIATFYIVVLSGPQQAQACRDCPFPMGNGNWLMPNKRVMVSIQEQYSQNRFVDLYVSLVNTESGDVIAFGAGRYTRGLRNVRVVLYDASFRPIQAHIRWLNRKSNRLSIQLSCINDCSINSLLK